MLCTGIVQINSILSRYKRGINATLIIARCCLYKEPLLMEKVLITLHQISGGYEKTILRSRSLLLAVFFTPLTAGSAIIFG
jgi:hypothetical protein